jgi:hypothetical protein
MIRVTEGSATVELEADEVRLMNGALKVSYRGDDLILAAVRILDAIGDRRAEEIRRSLTF